MVTVLHTPGGLVRLRLYKALWLDIVLISSIVCLGKQHCLAQSCTGISTDLIINQSFGTAGDKPSLTGLTTYQYSTTSCPNNGQYTIASRVDGSCFDNAWHTVTEDHTPGDTQGNMLIINASNEVGAFYQQPLPGLCGGTQYEFSVWGLNLLRPGICSAPTLPNLTIRIETTNGLVLQTINFGSITLSQTPTWRQFSTLFKAPLVNEPVIVKLINNQEAGGCGNDFALDDIQLKQCDACAPEPVYVPDAFTPNNDGLNDVLAVFLPDAVTFRIKIYNRWGNVVFVSDTLTDRWNGTYGGNACPTGDYTWVITYQHTDAASVIREYVRTGHVLLLR